MSCKPTLRDIKRACPEFFSRDQQEVFGDTKHTAYHTDGNTYLLISRRYEGIGHEPRKDVVVYQYGPGSGKCPLWFVDSAPDVADAKYLADRHAAGLEKGGYAKPPEQVQAECQHEPMGRAVPSLTGATLPTCAKCGLIYDVEDEDA